MVAFIKQEAVEKAREIEIKADEEAAIEKSKLVRQETATIDALYERKFKQAALSQQIARSTVTNKTRLEVLAARQHLLDDLFDRARAKLADINADNKAYAAVLKNLVLEGLYALDEDSVLIRARPKDLAVLKDAIELACKEYKGHAGKDVSVVVDDANPLPDDS